MTPLVLALAVWAAGFAVFFAECATFWLHDPAPRWSGRTSMALLAACVLWWLVLAALAAAMLLVASGWLRDDEPMENDS